MSFSVHFQPLSPHLVKLYHESGNRSDQTRPLQRSVSDNTLSMKAPTAKNYLNCLDIQDRPSRPDTETPETPEIDLAVTCLMQDKGVAGLSNITQMVHSGSTNNVYCGRYHWQPIIIRSPCDNQESLAIKRQDELKINVLASLCGVSPRLNYFDDSGWMISHKMEAGDLAKAAQGQRLTVPMEDIARLLNKIHALPAPRSLRSFGDLLFDQIAELERLHLDHSPSLDRIIDHTKNFLTSEEYQSLDTVLCHTDLNPRNILTARGDYFAIDWETACTGSALIDAASVSVEFDLNEDEEKALLHALKGDSPNKNHYLEMYPKIKRAYQLRPILWLLIQGKTVPNQRLNLEYLHVANDKIIALDEAYKNQSTLSG